MRFLHRLRSLGRNLVRRRKFEEQLTHELAAHLDLLTEEKVRAGSSLAEARREALLEFGGVEQVKEEVREARRGFYLESVLRDFRYAARSLRRAPAFSIVAALILAIGSGAAIGLFAIADATLGRPLNFPRPNELLRLWEHSDEKGLRESHVSLPKFAALREENVFADMGAYAEETARVRTPSSVVQLSGARVSDTLLPLLGVQAEHGKLFAATETKDVAVISHQCWQNHFDGNPAVIGEPIAINGRNHTIIGVLPADVSAPLAQFEVILPKIGDIDFFTPQQIARGAGYLHLIARCRAEKMPLVAAALKRVDERYRRAFPENMDVIFTSEASDLTASVTREVRPSLYALAAAIGCLFILASLNVSCLFLARFAAHRQEFALRSALGAENRRIVQHLFSEIAIVTASGLALGLLISAAGIYGLHSIGSPLLSVTMTWSTATRALAFAAILFGIISIPLTAAAALHAARWKFDGAMPPAHARRTTLLRNAFVIGQIALALVLLLAAGLLTSTLRRVQDVKLGFDPAGVIVADMTFTPSRYDGPQYQTFVDEFIRSVENLPKVERAALVYGLPFAHDDTYMLSAALNKDTRAVRDWPMTYFRVISPSYFEAMRIPLFAGRTFTFEDQLGSAEVVILSKTTARMFFDDADPIGQKVICGGTVPTPHEVVGVVDDVRSTDVTRPGRPEIYFPVYQQREPAMKLVVRLAGRVEDARFLAPSIVKTLQTLDPEQPALEFKTMDQLVSKSVANRKLLALALTVFASLALALAMVGTYGVMNFAIVERRGEIGLRIALGASPGHILRLVFTGGFKLALTGLCIGTVVAFTGARYLSGLLFDVSPTDPAIFLGAWIILATLTLVAIYFPARRALRVDPIIAMRV